MSEHDGQNTRDEVAVCTRCGRHVDMVIQLSLPGEEKGPPLCSKCFRAVCTETVKRAKAE